MSSPAQFRSDFPEFGDTMNYTDALITFWMTVSTTLVNASRWGELADMGIELCTAHHLVIATRDQNVSNGSGTPGQVSGPVTSKAVDRVSVSYDTGSATLSDAGFWNMSNYGIRFLQLARIMGAGPIQL